ncbi:MULTISPECIES: chromosomal replication initiator protein DnaA [Streptomyces]|uniref:hypothetical protein n=1 Tax=Streptomyces TaxID=1883 RepID=UPI0020BFFB17|nr:hypothetical protein [Streptomyces sp. 43Y-GA-1]MCL6292958.1 hypothetical protein [Streptomyces sp. 43Y-GA-1]
MHRVGIESDQLVYDYLSRVGDLAQQQQLSSGARMRLVSTLRGEIDRQRGTEGADSPAAVRRIIGRLGSPDELVAAAAGSADGTVPLPSARTGPGTGEQQRRGLPRPRSGLLRKAQGGPEEPASGAGGGRESRGPGKPKAGFGRGASRRDRDPQAGDTPESRTETTADTAAVPGPSTAPDDTGVPARDWPDPNAPHMLGQDRQTGAGDATDWWRLEPGPFDEGTAVPGFFGGIEAPELLGRRPIPLEKDEKKDEKKEEKQGDGKEAEGGEAAEDGAAGAAGTARRRRALRLVKLRRRKAVPVAAAPEAAAPAPRGGFAHPLLVLAAVLLVAGVVTGSWLPLAGGWLIAYSSRTLSRTEAKWAALGLPGVVAATALVWIWGRMEGRWGEPIREGAMRDVLLETWPVVVRVAAVASALYLVWRARRRTG